MKKTIITIAVLVIIIIGAYFFFRKPPAKAPLELPQTSSTATTSQTAPITGSQAQNTPGQTVIGTSVGGNPIIAYQYGTGTAELLVVGGIHGGYEWNTVLLAQQLADYLKANPSVIPSNVKVTVIPVLNPDGLAKVAGTTTGNFAAAQVSASQSTLTSGRFNGSTVDLNRNFDCDWQSTGTWQNISVSGGSSAFSEPESKAIENYIQANTPAAVLVWYSAAGGVYASSCHNGVSKETDSLVKTFAAASGYTAHETFDSYPTTGDMTNWLAKVGIPTISVLLTNHTDTEWSKNIAGVKALLAQLSTK